MDAGGEDAGMHTPPRSMMTPSSWLHSAMSSYWQNYDETFLPYKYLTRNCADDVMMSRSCWVKMHTHRQLAPHSLTGWQTGKQDKWLNSVQVHVKLLAGLGWAGLGNTSAKLAKVGPVCPDSLQLVTSTEKVDIFLVDKSLHTFTENWKIVRHIAPQDSCCWDGGLTAWHHTPPAQSYTSLRRDQPPR